MRGIGLLLILANLGFLGWSQLVDVRASRVENPERVRSAAAPRLVLSTEASEAVRSSGQKATSAPDKAVRDGATQNTVADNALVSDIPGNTTAGDIQCVSVGAFRDLAEAVQASATLQAVGYFSRQRMEQGDVWLGYWVSVQNLASREAAENALADLAQRGISDAYILPGSESTNTLSLGVFTDQARAQRRVEEIRALGLDAQLADRRRAGSVYWLDVSLPSPGALFDPAVLQTQPGKIVRLDFRSCPEGTEAVAGANPAVQLQG
jgi:SPOR domain